MGRPKCLILDCVLYSTVLALSLGQYQGNQRDDLFPQNVPLGEAHDHGLAEGPHGGGQPPFTGGGTFPQYPSAKKPAGRRRPVPPSVVTTRPVAPIVPVVPVVPVKPEEPSFQNPIMPNPTIGVILQDTVPPTDDIILIPRVTPRRQPYHPRPRPRVTDPPLPCSAYQNNLCLNRGYCYKDPISRTPHCRCRPMYAGNRCEIVLRSPKNITIVGISTNYVSITWEAPPVEIKRITGFVVQYNKFGDTNTKFSPNIHPAVNAYTLRDLEPESQYTICINIIFKNITTKRAILRDQCLEVRTEPLEYTSDGISLTFMAIIVGAIVLVLFIIMIIALLIQRRCLKPIQKPMRTIQRAISRRSVLQAQRHKHNANHHNHTNHINRRLSTRDRRVPSEAEAKVSRIPPESHRQQSNPFFARLHTNNANNAHYNRDWALPVSVNYTRLHVPDIQPPQYTRSSSCSQAVDLIEMRRPSRVELSTFAQLRHPPQPGRKPQRHQKSQRTSSVPNQTSIRPLPPTISNQVMRSKNAREKDASSEFDMRGTHMYFSASKNLTS